MDFRKALAPSWILSAQPVRERSQPNRCPAGTTAQGEPNAAQSPDLSCFSALTGR